MVQLSFNLQLKLNRDFFCFFFFFFFLLIVTVATLNRRDANANEETLHVFSNRKNTFKGSGGRAWFTIIENKDLPVILCLKKVEVLLDTIAQLADREFILLARLWWTLKHQIKRIRLAARSIRNVFYSSKRTACRSLYIKIVPKDERTNFHATNSLSHDLTAEKYETRLKPLPALLHFTIKQTNGYN